MIAKSESRKYAGRKAARSLSPRVPRRSSRVAEVSPGGPGEASRRLAGSVAVGLAAARPDECEALAVLIVKEVGVGLVR
jgi:hypothetical protein